MKKLMILAVMLAMVAAAAIPAVAQDKERDSGNGGEDSRGTIVANPNPRGDAPEGDVSFNAAPAGDGFEVAAPNGSSESGGCSDADKISLRSIPADDGGDESGSVTAAPSPGCSYVVIEK